MALFNTPAYNQRVASMAPTKPVAPVSNKAPEIPWYMKQQRADDRVIGGPVERQGFGGALDRMRSTIDNRVAAEGLQKKYAELIETQKRDRANRWLDKWFTMNPEGLPNDAAEYYREMLEDDSNLQLSRKHSLGQMGGMINQMPSGPMRTAYEEQLRILSEMARGRNARDYMDYKPTAPMGRRPWQKPSSDFYSA
jgi:hypothetical protein